MGRISIIIALNLLVCRVNHAESTETKGAPDLADLSLEALMNIEVPTVYGASKLEQKTTEAPSSITVIGSDEIKKYGYRTLADILQSVQGFHVSYDRNYAFLGTRGVNLGDFNSRVLVLVNGHRVNNNLTDGAYIDTAFVVDVDLIDRVEIIRGPGSVLYGNNAFFGVINVITRLGKQVNGAEVSGEYGEFDTWKGRATYGESFTNGLRVLVSGSLYDSEGEKRLFYPEFNSPTSNNGIARNMDGDEFGSFFGSVGYKDFTWEGAFMRREKVNPTAQYVGALGFNDPRLRTVDERSYTVLKYNHSFDNAVDLTAQIYYDRSDFEIGYPFGTMLLTEKDTGEWWGAEVQVNKRLWDKHIITVGAEYRDDFRLDRELTGQAPVRSDFDSYGIFAQADFAVVTNLHLNGGVRYDQYGDFDAAFNPRLAAIYNPVPGSTIKAIYGKAFRAPNFLELALSQNGDLEPEKISAYELVYEQEWSRHWRSSLSGFYNEMDRLIVFENGSFTNFDATTKGMELALTGNWTNGFRVRGSYTFQDTENRSTDQGLTDSPAHLLKLNLIAPIFRDKLFAGLEYQYTSSRETVFTTTTGTTVRGVDAGGFGIVNLTLFSQNLVKNLELSASVYNIFDKTYSDPATRFHQQDLIEREGRSFRFKLTYRF